VRSPMRLLGSTVLVFEALVVFFGGLVARTLSDLSGGQALAIFGVLALACLGASGLLRRRLGYVVGSLLQVAVVATGAWVTAMFGIGGLFALLWFGALLLGRYLERQPASP